jgi:hypothetical protein
MQQVIKQRELQLFEVFISYKQNCLFPLYIYLYILYISFVALK